MMEADLKAKLAQIADEYARASKLALSTVMARAVGDARFFDRLNEGRGFNVKTFDRVIQYFADTWPEGGVWPADIDRPEPTRASEALAS